LYKVVGIDFWLLVICRVAVGRSGVEPEMSKAAWKVKRRNKYGQNRKKSQKDSKSGHRSVWRVDVVRSGYPVGVDGELGC